MLPTAARWNTGHSESGQSQLPKANIYCWGAGYSRRGTRRVLGVQHIRAGQRLDGAEHASLRSASQAAARCPTGCSFTFRTAGERTGDERGAVEAVMPDRGRVALRTEQHLLVGDEPRHPHGVHRCAVDVLAPSGSSAGGIGVGRQSFSRSAISFAVRAAVPDGVRPSVCGW